MRYQRAERGLEAARAEASAVALKAGVEDRVRRLIAASVVSSSGFG